VTAWVGVWTALAVWCVARRGGRAAARLGARPPRSVARWRRRGTGGAVRVRVVVAQVVASLRAGTPPGVAWTRVAGVPTGPDGVPDRDVLADVLGGAGAAAAVVAAARLAHDVGAPPARVLEAVGAALTAEAEAEAERAASLAGPQATARVLLWLPVLGLVLGTVLGADPWGTATDGGAGTAAVVVGVLALGVGRWWSRRLVAAARRAGGTP
jgi:tight adherence protein B